MELELPKLTQGYLTRVHFRLPVLEGRMKCRSWLRVRQIRPTPLIVRP
jgi:hypothetical protein